MIPKKSLCVLAVALTFYGCGSKNDDIQMTEAEARVPGAPGPILDTHVHFYQPTRAGGVPWPTPTDSELIYRDVLPPEYKALATANGVKGTGVVEASPLVEDNQWILDLLGNDPFYPFFVGSLEIGSADFIANLDRFSKDKRFVGIRGFLWSPALTLDATQLSHLRELATRGMTLDIISRGTTNPKPKVKELCTSVPKLKVIINHLAGAQGEVPSEEWTTSMKDLAAACANLSIKFSSFYDMYPAGTVYSGGTVPGDAKVWNAPTDLKYYKPTFDVLMSAFGADRLIWASNWAVSDLGGGKSTGSAGSFAGQIRIAEEYLAPLGQVVRDKVMFKNAQLTYRRHVP